MINLSQVQSLQQRLSPQQVQYLKMLQLPMLALEQSIKAELEQNPLLEEIDDIEFTMDAEPSLSVQQDDDVPVEIGENEIPVEHSTDEDFSYEDYQNDEPSYNTPDSYAEEREDAPAPATKTLTESLLEQIPELDLTPDEELLAQEIIGNIGSDGYLRRDLEDIIADLGKWVSTSNTHPSVIESSPVSLNSKRDYTKSSADSWDDNGESGENTDSAFGLSANGSNGTTFAGSPAMTNGTPSTARESSFNGNGSHELEIRGYGDSGNSPATGAYPAEVEPSNNGTNSKTDDEQENVQFTFNVAAAEKVLAKIHNLDPLGVGARSLKECLLIQIRAIPHRTRSQELAMQILDVCFDAFAHKHFDVMIRELNTTAEALSAALDEIHKLNPKPGNTAYAVAEQTIIPDFLVEREDGELVITLNDSWLPRVRINTEYSTMLERGRNSLPRDTRVFLRQKFDSAKFFISSLQQRRNTMMAVMRTIVELQKDFFLEGEHALKPIFYKHVADIIGMDVSTVCRVVNNKYMQCDWGIYELRWFFNDRIATSDGEDVANRVLKNRVKEIIQGEDKQHPLSDAEIVQLINQEGYDLARRTVAKYREEQGIPVSRLRREMRKNIS